MTYIIDGKNPRAGLRGLSGYGGTGGLGVAKEQLIAAQAVAAGTASRAQADAWIRAVTAWEAKAAQVRQSSLLAAFKGLPTAQVEAEIMKLIGPRPVLSATPSGAGVRAPGLPGLRLPGGLKLPQVPAGGRAGAQTEVLLPPPPESGGGSKMTGLLVAGAVGLGALLLMRGRG